METCTTLLNCKVRIILIILNYIFLTKVDFKSYNNNRIHNTIEFSLSKFLKSHTNNYFCLSLQTARWFYPVSINWCLQKSELSCPFPWTFTYTIMKISTRQFPLWASFNSMVWFIFLWFQGKFLKDLIPPWYDKKLIK